MESNIIGDKQVAKLGKKLHDLIETGQSERNVEFVGKKRIGGMWKVWVRKARTRLMKSKGMLMGSDAKKENMARKGNIL